MIRVAASSWLKAIWPRRGKLGQRVDVGDEGPTRHDQIQTTHFARDCIDCLNCLRSKLRWGQTAMQRRQFISLFGGAVCAWSATARAQRAGIQRRIAMVAPSRPVEELKTFFRPFLDTLAQRGFVEGQNLIVDRYSGLGQINTYGDVARTAVSGRPEVIFTSGNPMTMAVRDAARNIPIVTIAADPIL